MTPPLLYKIFEKALLSGREFPVMFLFSALVGIIIPTVYLLYTGKIKIDSTGESRVD